VIHWHWRRSQSCQDRDGWQRQSIGIGVDRSLAKIGMDGKDGISFQQYLVFAGLGRSAGFGAQHIS